MIQSWVVAIIIVVSWLLGVGFMYLLMRMRRSSEVDRTEYKKERPLNFFDAYSDKDLQTQRDEAAKAIRYYRTYGYNDDKKVAYLRQIDDEIAARKNTKLALEEDKRTTHERDIAIFDTVYGEVLRNSKINKL